MLNYKNIKYSSIIVKNGMHVINFQGVGWVSAAGVAGRRLPGLGVGVPIAEAWGTGAPVAEGMPRVQVGSVLLLVVSL